MIESISAFTNIPTSCRIAFLVIVAFCGFGTITPGTAADFSEAEQRFFAGQYAEAEAVAAAEVDSGIWNEKWSRLLIQCQLTTGQYPEALNTYDSAIKRYSSSLTLRMLGLQVLRYNNLTERVEEAEAEILQVLQMAPGRYISRDNLIATGRYFANDGKDARQILKVFYDRVRDSDPTYVEAYIATAELALDKGDFKVAAETLQQAQKLGSSDPRIAYLLARAWQPSDPKKSTDAIKIALGQNPNHVPTLLLLANQSIDREQYDEAEATIGEVLAINLHEQQAWSLLAVLAHLRGKYEIESLMRAAAKSTWETNPMVDHWIGLKLSQNYRFEEGSQYQSDALTLDPTHTAASFQLAQDLLRLGYDDVGWELAHQVANEDQYNVIAHNLITLHDRLKNFSVLESGNIHVRMDPKEAEIYGEAMLDLLTEAEAVLCEKYDVEPNAPIAVEIFPEQKDFAIRTFGLPGGAGFLGVCFGRVITANSPASQGPRPSNWRRVLWHEFCHVVTLEKTKNRMPRWLSEGISVYEERQHSSSWGESMTPQYREMLMDVNLTPVSNLSAAFLSPPTPIHLQFAYFQSSLVVEFLVDRHGVDALKQVLSDLGDGLTINDALVRSVGSLAKLDSQFADYAREQAEAFGPELDWSKEGLPDEASREQLEGWLAENPDNYWGLWGMAQADFAAKRYEQARSPLERLRKLEAVTAQRNGPLEMLAEVYRALDQPDEERKVLEEIVEISSDALPALRRLMDIANENEDWQTLSNYAMRVLAINPLLPTGHEQMARASEELKQPADVVRSLRALNTMDPIDPAAIDYQMAQAFADLNQIDRAKHHVLRALQEAPRYRDAHRLLLNLIETQSESESTQPKSAESSLESEEAPVTPQPAEEIQ